MSLDAERMKSVNVVMTPEMIMAIDAIDSTNRSAVVRKVLAAILAAHADNRIRPFEIAVEHAHCSSARNRRLVQEAGISWEKSIIWIPERMHRRIDRMLSIAGLRVSDFIRGAMIGYTRIDPMRSLEVQLSPDQGSSQED